jgi:hypothetical protein
MSTSGNIGHPEPELDSKDKRMATCAQDAIECLGIDVPKQLFRRFGHWTQEQDWLELLLHVTDPENVTHQLEFCWYPYGH